MTTTIQKLDSKRDFAEFIQTPSLKLIHFSTSWSSSCADVDKLITKLQAEYPKAFVPAIIDAEEMNEVSDAYQVTSAPTVLFFKNNKCVDRLVGLDELGLKTLVVKHLFGDEPAACTDDINSSQPAPKETLEDRLKKLINKSRLTLFMKGSAAQPKCGFSRQIIEILNNLNVDYWTFDILSDEEVRQSLKTYSDWPTYPQLYLDGELLGGLDVIREEIQNVDFVAKLPKRS